MPDDGSYKGHGGKPGRKSKVVSISAHKNRHSGDLVAGKKLSSLTLFDFSAADFDAEPDGDYDYAVDEPGGSTALAAEELDPLVPGALSDKVSRLDGAVLPCENTPFERNNEDRPSNLDRGRKSLRWGLEPRDAEAGPSSLPEAARKESRRDKAYENFDRPDRLESNKWQNKTGSTGSLLESFYHALNGLYAAFDTERNVRIHCCIAAAVLVMALALKVDVLGCLALILVTAFVLFAEYINTAIEHVTDIQAGFRHHPSAKLAKDTAAGAVVIAAVTAVLVGAIVFIPRLWAFACGSL